MFPTVVTMPPATINTINGEESPAMQSIIRLGIALRQKAQALDDWVERHILVKLGLGLALLIGLNALLYWLFTSGHHASDFIPIPIGSGIVFVFWSAWCTWLHYHPSEREEDTRHGTRR